MGVNDDTKAALPRKDRTMDQMIAFFDIDGTLTSEKDGEVPCSAAEAIRRARQNGHRMFLCSGRVLCNIEERFRTIGFDGIVCGCGTHVVLEEEGELLHRELTAEVTHELLHAARDADVDILFEAAGHLGFDRTRPIRHPFARGSLRSFEMIGYDTYPDVDRPDYSCDKLCIFASSPEQAQAFFRVSEKYLDVIDRGGGMYEMVPRGFSKATGIQAVLDHYGMSLQQAYVFGDSNNDLSMLQYVPHSVVMGNAQPRALLDLAWYKAPKASEDGIYRALKDLGFFQ